ncbi:unnamed protein product, partial [Rotaria magnacalcarata]
LNNHAQSSSECSTPSVINQPRSSSISQQPTTRPLIAKCQSCNIRGDLIVCNHCDNVICIKCADEHQSVINSDVKREWDLCKTQFQAVNDQSIRFDQMEEEAINKARSLQTFISKKSDQLIQTVENQKNTYIDTIEKYLWTYKQSFVHEQLVDEYESIDKRVEDLLNKSTDATSDKVDDFLFEIEHLESRLDNLNKILDSNQIKFPLLTLPEEINTSSLFGTLEFIPLNSNVSTTSDPCSLPMTNGYNHSQTKSEEQDYVFVDSSSNHFPKSFLSSAIEQISSLSSNSPTPNKKLLWQIDYFSVPYYVRTYENQLFICDKYGSLAIYKLNKSNDIRQKPSLVREIKLFKDYPTLPATDEDQTIIDSFVVYKLWIIVFKRKKNELHGTIYLFTHDGKLIQNGKCIHNHPSRELTIDTERNILWSLDQKQLCLFYYDLPDTKPNNPEEYFHNRCSHVQFSKPFAPIHISVNKNVLAVLDKNRQAVHVYDKRTREELYEHVNIYGNSTHFCWDMALFSDNSLLIKLDEMSSLKSGPSKHIYLQLDITKKNNILGIIEETDAYGMMITSTDEILIGSLVIDNVVNDLVRQHIKQKQNSTKKVVDYDSISISSQRTEQDTNPNDQHASISVVSSSLPSTLRKQVAVAQPPCTICKKKSNMIILCEHCKSDICEFCMEKHYQIISDMLSDKWIQCKEKFNQINSHVALSHKNKTIAVSKLDAIRKTIEERSKNLKHIIDSHRQTLSNHIDNHIQNMEQIIKSNDVFNEYESVKNRLPKILQEETNTSNLVSFLEETDTLLQQLIERNKKLKELETKIPYLSQPDSISINLSQLIGELKLDDSSSREGLSSSTTALGVDNNHNAYCNYNSVPSLMSTKPEQTRFPRRMRSSFRSRGGRGGNQHLSHLSEFYTQNKSNPRNSR